MNDKEDFNFLQIAQNVYFFKKMNLSEFKAIKEYLDVYEFKKSEKILVQKYKSESLYFLYEGVCGVYKGSIKQSNLVDVKISGDCFGEISFFTGNKATASVVAHQDVKIASINREQFKELVQLHPRIGYVVFKNLFVTIFERFDQMPQFFSNLFLWGYNSKESIMKKQVKSSVVNILKGLMFFIWLLTIVLGGLGGNVLFDTHFYKYFPAGFSGKFIFVIIGMLFLSSILLCIWFLIDFGINWSLRSKRFCQDCKFYQKISDKPMCMINFIKRRNSPSPVESHHCDLFERKG